MLYDAVALSLYQAYLAKAEEERFRKLPRGTQELELLKRQTEALEKIARNTERHRTAWTTR